MSLPVSNQLRICSSCDAAIDPGCKYSHDPDGDVVCEDCTPSEVIGDYEYADEDEYGPLGDMEWDDIDDIAYEDTW